MRQSKKILIAPLNWGLGHATRSVPIIRELVAQGAEVFLASDGRALELLKKEFPTFPTFELPGYGISYRSKNITNNIGRSLLKLAIAVFRENRIVNKIIKNHNIDGIISDNRLGCFSKKIHCAYISHQIDLIAPLAVLQWIGRRLNYFFIKKYKECWVPDSANEPNLSGTLSHDTPIKNIKYIGALSRMKNYQAGKKYDVVVVLSGPEPQRTILEEAIKGQAQKLPYRFLIVQGKTESSDHFWVNKNTEVISCMTSKVLNEAILSSDLFIGRTGYSSIMDLVKLNKSALLIPTPGQTEQEYLGELFSKNNIFHIQSQGNLNLSEGIPIAMRRKKLHGHFFDDEKIKKTIMGFLEKC